MADVISIASSVTGLLQAGAKVVAFISTMKDAPSLARNVLSEAHSIIAIFHQLQDFILSLGGAGHEDRKSMLYIDQIVATLTGCVCAFSELEEALESVGGVQGPELKITLWDRAKWAEKDMDLRRILGDLERHKSSLNLMLTIYNCESNRKARKCMEQLSHLMEAILHSSPDLAARMHGYHPGDESDTATIQSFATRTMATIQRRPSVSSIKSTLSRSTMKGSPALGVSATMDYILNRTRVYRMASKNHSTNSFNSIFTSESKWSQLSGLSISQVSEIAVICLPITASELFNGTPYISTVRVTAHYPDLVDHDRYGTMHPEPQFRSTPDLRRDKSPTPPTRLYRRWETSKLFPLRLSSQLSGVLEKTPPPTPTSPFDPSDPEIMEISGAASELAILSRP